MFSSHISEETNLFIKVDSAFSNNILIVDTRQSYERVSLKINKNQAARVLLFYSAQFSKSDKRIFSIQ